LKYIKARGKSQTYWKAGRFGRMEGWPLAVRGVGIKTMRI
jgi:hypothetical protein